MMSAAGLCSIFGIELHFAGRKSLAPQQPEVKTREKIDMVVQSAGLLSYASGSSQTAEVQTSAH